MKTACFVATLCLAMVAGLSANAQTAFNGLIEINYNADGTWNRNDVSGVQGIKYTGVDFSAPGTPWQHVTIGFNGQEIKGNFAYGGNWDWMTPAGVDIYNGPCYGSICTWFVSGSNGEQFVVVKQEKMCRMTSVVKVLFCVTNTGEVPLERFSLIHGVDPDQDIQDHSLYPTENDVVSNGHLATALGVKSGLTIAYGLCDSRRQQVGFTNWSQDAAPTLYDPNGNYSDITVHCITRYDVIDPFQSKAFKFYVLFASKASVITIENLYDQTVKKCCCCDLSNKIELPDGPPGGGGSSDDKALIDSIKARVLAGEESEELSELLPLLASPFNLNDDSR